MNKIALLLSLLVLTSGCVSSGPPNNESFGRIKNINDLEGVYTNLGEGDPYIPHYLTCEIWPEDEDIIHASIETVEIRVRNECELVIMALADDEIQRTKVLVEEEDFKIRSGRIQIGRALIPSLAYPSGNPFIGLAYADMDIGLDRSGHGKGRMRAAFAGLAYFIPLAGGVCDDVRFIRISD